MKTIDLQDTSLRNGVLVIGAGISGLTAARKLQEQGLDVLILEKSAGLGGRMATRRIENGVFDHGAQFFTVRSREFNDFVHQLQQAGIVNLWCHGFENKDGHPRYCGREGMTLIPKFIAKKLNVHFHQWVITVGLKDDRWHVQTEAGNHYIAKGLIITSPLPQSVALLDESPIDDGIEGGSECLREVTYDPCIAFLASLDKPSRIPDPGALKIDGDLIAFLADNQQKGISSIPAVTIHASPEFSQEHYHEKDERITRILLGSVKSWMPESPKSVQIKRWRYSQPKSVIDKRCWILREDPPLVLAGDAFAESRIEGAFLSGVEASKQMLKIFHI